MIVYDPVSTTRDNAAANAYECAPRQLGDPKTVRPEGKVRIMTMWRGLALLFALTAAFAVGCGDDDGGDPDASTDTDTDTDTDVDTDTDTDTDSDSDGDLTTGCADAIPIELTATAILSGDLTLQTPEDEDFYSFTSLADVWVFLWTDIYPDDQTEEPTGFLDPVIELYNEDGSVLLASADDEVPRFSMDSSLIYHVATAGTYCVKVQGWEHWAGQASSEPTTDWDYSLLGGTLNTEADSVTMDSEPNETLGAATEVSLGESDTNADTFTNLYGMAGGASDVDFYTFTQPTGDISTTIYFRPSGPGSAGVQGHGSTLDLGVVNVYDGEGNVVAALDVALGSESMSIPIAAGEVVGIEVVGADDWTPGANDFYAILVYNGETDNTPEEDETDLLDGGVVPGGGNDTAATANETTPQATTVGNSTFVLGNIDPAGDVDYFAFDVVAGETLNLACGAARSGSGLVGARFAIHSAADAELQAETESPESDVIWSSYPGASMAPLTISANATYYLRVSATGQDADVLGKYYRCGIHRVTPTDK
jgi:hypothetical protein